MSEQKNSHTHTPEIESALATLRRYVELGWYLFPLVPNTKRPATRHGYKDATNDWARIERWHRRHPDSNWAVACEASGICVVDLDVDRGGFESFSALLSTYGSANDHVYQNTPSGGAHIFYRALPDLPVRCTNDVLGRGIDTRGIGGYIVVEPSRIDGVPYVFPSSREPREDMPSVPRWMAELLQPQAPVRIRASLDRFADDKWRVGLLMWLSGVKEGNRNEALYWAACRYRERAVPMDDALHDLVPIIVRAGLSSREAERTVRSAYNRR
ncbi:MAG: bifunctional DNA primase/polymerase [Anaerolineae bacterium]|nr:bifunctional DNA primase/polymerase [Anaerolineae bacterium]